MELYFRLKSCPTLSLFLNFVVRMTARERIWVSLGTHTLGLLILGCLGLAIL